MFNFHWGILHMAGEGWGLFTTAIITAFFMGNRFPSTKQVTLATLLFIGAECLLCQSLTGCRR